MKYDSQNIFAKIIRQELPCNKIYENQHSLAFHDIYPDAPIHALVIPKGPYMDWHDFVSKASTAEILSLNEAMLHTVKLLQLQDGYRIGTNIGSNAHQEILHFHYHILAGHKLGGMTTTKK